MERLLASRFTYATDQQEWIRIMNFFIFFENDLWNFETRRTWLLINLRETCVWLRLVNVFSEFGRETFEYCLNFYCVLMKLEETLIDEIRRNFGPEYCFKLWWIIVEKEYKSDLRNWQKCARLNRWQGPNESHAEW